MSRKKRGFTLAELLIVVAIIAVLVSVAIPVFNGQLEKSRRAVDLDNMKVISNCLTYMYLQDELRFSKNYISVTCFSEYNNDTANAAVYVDGSGVSPSLKEKLEQEFSIDLDSMLVKSKTGKWKYGYTVIISRYTGQISYTCLSEGQAYGDIWSFWESKYHGLDPLKDKDKNYSG